MHTFLNTACMFSLLLGLLCKLVNLSAVGRGGITARLCFPDVVLRYLRFTLATPAILYTDYSNREACRVMQYQCLTESSAKLLMLYGVYICRTGMHPESNGRKWALDALFHSFEIVSGWRGKKKAILSFL